MAIRADALERLAAAARKLAAQGPFAPTRALCKAAGCREADLAVLLPALGYRRDPEAAEPCFLPRGGRRARSRGTSAAPGESPFAKLRDLEGL